MGYRGTGRTGVYYLPKSYKTRPLPVLILLHGSGVNGNWMLQSLPFKQYADKNQVTRFRADCKQLRTLALTFMMDGNLRGSMAGGYMWDIRTYMVLVHAGQPQSLPIPHF